MKQKHFEDDIVVIRLNKSEFDVFTGDFGWDTWSRFKLNNHKVSLVAGESVDPQEYTRIRKIISKEM